MTWISTGTFLRLTLATETGTSPPPPFFPPGGVEPLLEQPYKTRQLSTRHRLGSAFIEGTIPRILPRMRPYLVSSQRGKTHVAMQNVSVLITWREIQCR